MEGTLNNAARAPRTKMLEARLVTSRVVQSSTVIENEAPKQKPGEGTPLQKSQRASQPAKSSAVPAKPAESAVAASPRAALPLPFDPIFNTWREVDVAAKLQGSGNPPDPTLALQAGISGRVTLEVWVDETGKVLDAQVIEADPPGYFEEVTVTHYRALRFTPAMKDGTPRRYRSRFLVEFGEVSTSLDRLGK